VISEKTICEVLSSMLPSGRLNQCFESDAEVIRLDGKTNCLFTTDEFSAEDLFRENDPRLLGWNVAAGAISDILACGGTPLFYAHALTVDSRWDDEYLHAFAVGVRDVLEATGARFIGGDCGRSELWRCTASVIGSCERTPISRRGAAPGDGIYLSGSIGAGNLQAALRLFQNNKSPVAGSFALRLPLRQAESVLLRRYASCCMDTSDGVCAALQTIADLNGCGYLISDLPYLPTALQFCREASLPAQSLFLGECGEYELLATVRPDREAAFLADAQKSGCAFHRLGSITDSGRVLHGHGQAIDLTSWRIQARDCDSPTKYLKAMVQWLGQSNAVCDASSGRERS
jgi:thiamine-monophosphate kinase